MFGDVLGDCLVDSARQTNDFECLPEKLVAIVQDVSGFGVVAGCEFGRLPREENIGGPVQIFVRLAFGKHCSWRLRSWAGSRDWI